MKNILVPVDLSPFSKEIALQTADLAQLIGGRLILLHVVSLDVGFIIGDVGFQYLPELEKTTLQADIQKLNELKDFISQKNVEVDAIVKQGIPVDTILEQVQELGIDTIAIGSKGHGTLYEAFVGSVCRDVIKGATVPVYVIPNQPKTT